MIPVATSGRPYRSHRVPACTACRRRKIRCKVDASARGCEFCRERQIACDFSYGTAQRDVDHASEESSRRHTTLSKRLITPVTATEDRNSFTVMNPASSPSESSPLIMNPTMAEDVDILEKYLTSNTVRSFEEAQPYIHISHTGDESIVYHRVPRHRKGLRGSVDPGKTQREILDQIIGPFKTDVIKLYFHCFHPCFPILDDAGFWDLWKKDASRISPTLICDVYAVAILYWKRSPLLKDHARPDHLFSWNQAVIALRDDFLAPSITTLYSVLLDITGRPVLHIAGNIANVGRTVTLAHSLGLHRDPSLWRVTQTEKNLRIRTWWGVLIHDRWSSLSHGIPPNIDRANYDVGLPSAEMFASSGHSQPENKAFMSFVHLCSLTHVLEDTLPLVYTLNPGYEATWKNIRRIECLLDDWEDTLPEYLSMGRHGYDNTFNVNGASNLWFCYLSIKLLLHRIAFRMTLRWSSQVGPEAKDYRFVLLRNAASTVVDYAISLQSDQFNEFWLPYTAHLLVSATVVLLRCTVESSNRSQTSESAEKLLKLLGHLRAARDHFEWDLADFCLEKCAMPIERITASLSTKTSQAERQSSASNPAIDVAVAKGGPPEESNSNLEDFLDDTFLPTDSFDYPWDMLWHNVEGLFDKPE